MTKNQGKLLTKLAELIAECEEYCGIKIAHGDTVKMKHVKKQRKKLYALKKEENLVVVHGIGKRKSWGMDRRLLYLERIHTEEGILLRINRRFFWGFKTEYAISQIPKQRRGKCTCGKYSSGDVKKTE